MIDIEDHDEKLYYLNHTGCIIYDLAQVEHNGCPNYKIP